MGVAFLWCAAVSIAALGSFVALEIVTGSDCTSYPAIACLGQDVRTFTAFKTYTISGKACMCNGEKVSDVSVFASFNPTVTKTINSGAR